MQGPQRVRHTIKQPINLQSKPAATNFMHKCAGRNPDLGAAVESLVRQQREAKEGEGPAAQAAVDASMNPLEGIDLAPLHRWGISPSSISTAYLSLRPIS